MGLPAIHDLTIALRVPLRTRVSVGDLSAEVKQQPEQTAFLLTVDPLRIVGGPMIVGMGATGEEQDRDAVPGKVVVIRAIEDPLLGPAISDRGHPGLRVRLGHSRQRTAQVR